jgi:hypothetical protein
VVEESKAHREAVSTKKAQNKGANSTQEESNLVSLRNRSNLVASRYSMPSQAKKWSLFQTTLS